MISFIIKNWYRYSPVIFMAMRKKDDIGIVLAALKPIIRDMQRVWPVIEHRVKGFVDELVPLLETISPNTETDWSVERIQLALRKMRYVLEIDGEIGEVTKNAVRHYQESRGLVVDGWPGPKTILQISVDLIKIDCWNEVMNKKF